MPGLGSLTRACRPLSSSRACCGSPAKIEIERGSPKRPAGEISPDPSDEVEVVLKPRTEVGVSVERQSKRSKSRKAGDEEDVEMLGSAGEVLLPHLRFDCPKVLLFSFARDGSFASHGSKRLDACVGCAYDEKTRPGPNRSLDKQSPDPFVLNSTGPDIILMGWLRGTEPEMFVRPPFPVT